MNRFLDKVKQGASKASEKAQIVVELNRIQSQIESRRKDWEQNAYEIGCMAYNAYKDQKMESLSEQMAELAVLNLKLEEEIEVLEWKRCELRHEKRCEKCGEISAWISNFCSNCGEKLPEAPEHMRDAGSFASATGEAKRKRGSNDGYITLNPTPSSSRITPSDLKLDVHGEAVPWGQDDSPSNHSNMEIPMDEEEDMYFPPRSSRTGAGNHQQEQVDGPHVHIGARPVTTTIPADQKPCAGCGTLAPYDAKWCERCGAPFI
ncbi:zinc ribbon domain-containing protein [Paenibacillus sp. 1001270B_150601_E10]|uniref:zinc ribbon domain-containing protein n=1 Tax=Paenibacillus sp. 1001270B_150601_E10 TaxID=2787079 RepID=UPI00189DC4C9|nr:zinc ribbon domain-containing protein [Paenibacillus sp. 1001270B_150601_E10]